MKKTFNRILVIALTVAMVLGMAPVALADGGQQIGGGTFQLTDAPEIDYGNVVTFKDGSEYELTAQGGTSKNAYGDVVVSGVNGIIPENRVPTANGSDAYYDLVGWAIKDKDGNLELIDLTTYKFTKATEVFAVMQDVWPPYLDMKQDRTDWFYTYVRDLSIGGIVNGYDGYIFKPAGNVTWGEALKLIMLATGYETQEATDKHWASGYLAKAEIDGLVEIGYVTDLNKAITREEYAQVASKAMKLEDVTIETPFADTEEQAILNLYVAKIVEGSFDKDGNRLFKPDDLITRAEISTVIWRINNYYKAQ